MTEGELKSKLTENVGGGTQQTFETGSGVNAQQQKKQNTNNVDHSSSEEEVDYIDLLEVIFFFLINFHSFHFHKNNLKKVIIHSLFFHSLCEKFPFSFLLHFCSWKKFTLLPAFGCPPTFRKSVF